MATLNLQVAASTDDAYRQLSNDYFSLTYTAVQAGRYSSMYCRKGEGFRFQNVTIPQGTTIGSACLKLTANQNLSGTVCRTEISAEDVDDAPTFADDKAAFDSRYGNRTTAQVNWDGIGAWTTDTEYTSPDIKSVIQEIVDRAGWSSGNDIVIFWEDFDNESNEGAYRSCYSYDGSSVKAPKLVINYTAAAEEKASGDSGSGVEAISLRETGAVETGLGVEASLSAAAMLAEDAGSGSEIGGLLKSLYGEDGGSGLDIIGILISKAGHDLKLHGHQGQVGIPHKEVRL
jgi:hypothetical protein